MHADLTSSANPVARNAEQVVLSLLLLATIACDGTSPDSTDPVGASTPVFDTDALPEDTGTPIEAPPTAPIPEEGCPQIPTSAFDLSPDISTAQYGVDAAWDGERLWVAAAGPNGVKLVSLGCDGVPTADTLTLTTEAVGLVDVVAHPERVLVTWSRTSPAASFFAMVDTTSGDVVMSQELGASGASPALRWARAAAHDQGFLVAGVGGEYSASTLQTRSLDLHGLTVAVDHPQAPAITYYTQPDVGFTPDGRSRIAYKAQGGDVAVLDSADGLETWSSTFTDVSLSDDGAVTGWYVDAENVSFRFPDASLHTMTGGFPKAATLATGTLLGSLAYDGIQLQWVETGSSTGVPITLDAAAPYEAGWDLIAIGPYQALAVWGEGGTPRGQLVNLAL